MLHIISDGLGGDRMGWCFIYYRYDGLGGVSYNIVNDGWGGASYISV